MQISAVYPYITYEVPAAPEPLLEQAVRLTAIDLCERTLAYTAELDPIDAVAGVADYTLDAPSTQTSIVVVKQVWFDGIKLQPAATDELAQYFKDWRDLTAEHPGYFTQLDQETLRLVPFPSVSNAGAIKPLVALRPSLTATTLPDWFGEKYLQLLAAGAKSRVMGMPGQPWSNPDLAAFYGKQCALMTSAAEVEARKGFTRTNMQVQFRRA